MNALPKNIKMYRQRLGLSQEELAKKLNYSSRSSISNIELGKNDLPHSKVKDFADALNTTVSSLMGWSDSSAEDDCAFDSGSASICTSQSDAYDKCSGECCSGPVSSFSSMGEIDSDSEVIDFGKVMSEMPFYNMPIASATSVRIGDWLLRGDNYEFLHLENIPKKADFALKMIGESMMPMYLDSDIIFVRSNTLVECGQIGLFYLNGKGYIKLLQGDSLLSLNMRDEPIMIEEHDYFFCAGRVVGKAQGYCRRLI